MEAGARIESELRAAIDRAAAAGCPPTFAKALDYAVFPGGARVRPQLCLAVAGACGAPRSALSAASAAALELLHCASLVHDDLPCMDDDDYRRGKPTAHKAFTEALAVLGGDALCIYAFEVLSRQFVHRKISHRTKR